MNVIKLSSELIRVVINHLLFCVVFQGNPNYKIPSIKVLINPITYIKCNEIGRGIRIRNFAKPLTVFVIPQAKQFPRSSNISRPHFS